MQKGRLVANKDTISSFSRYWGNSIPSVAIKINTPHIAATSCNPNFSFFNFSSIYGKLLAVLFCKTTFLVSANNKKLSPKVIMSNITAVKKPSIANFHMHTPIKKYIVIDDPKSAIQRRMAIIFQVRSNTLPPM